MHMPPVNNMSTEPKTKVETGHRDLPVIHIPDEPQFKPPEPPKLETPEPAASGPKPKTTASKTAKS